MEAGPKLVRKEGTWSVEGKGGGQGRILQRLKKRTRQPVGDFESCGRRGEEKLKGGAEMLSKGRERRAGEIEGRGERVDETKGKLRMIYQKG